MKFTVTMVLQSTPAGVFYVLSTGQFEHLGKCLVELTKPF